MSESLGSPDAGAAIAGGWQILGIEHVGVLVDRLAEATRRVTEIIGIDFSLPLDRADLMANFFDFGDGRSRIELIEVKDEAQKAQLLGDSGTARIEHIAIEVKGLDSLLAHLQSIGVRAIDPPRQARSYRTFFTVPETTGGIMLQFVERPSRAG